MNSFRCAIFISLVTFLCSCDRESARKALQQAVPEKDRIVADYYIDLLRKKDLWPIERDFDPSLQGPTLRPEIEKMALLVPAEKPLSVKVIGFDTVISQDFSQRNITFEYEYPKSCLLINVYTRNSRSSFTLIGFTVTPLADSLERINRFSLLNKSFIQYAILLGVFTIPLFILVTLVICLKSKVKSKWLWMVFILFGIGKLTVDWTSGHWGFSSLNIQLFGSGMFAYPYGSWFFSISLPLGAIVFLLLRSKITIKSEQDAAANP